MNECSSVSALGRAPKSLQACPIGWLFTAPHSSSQGLPPATANSPAIVHFCCRAADLKSSFPTSFFVLLIIHLDPLPLRFCLDISSRSSSGTHRGTQPTNSPTHRRLARNSSIRPQHLAFGSVPNTQPCLCVITLSSTHRSADPTHDSAFYLLRLPPKRGSPRHSSPARSPLPALWPASSNTFLSPLSASG